MRISDWSSDVCSSDLATGSFETAVARAEASLGMFVVSSDPRDGTRYYDEWLRSEEHTSELQSLMRISYAVLCLKKKDCTYCWRFCLCSCLWRHVSII